MTDLLILLGAGLGLTALIAVPYALRHRRIDRETRAREAAAREAGLHEPVSLHPVIDLDRCIGSGGCVQVCPEGVIGFRDGRAVAVEPARCIGHGLCERACPMEAITLVFGTATRGVELPRIREDFETNVPGLYIAGELGGMGLIRNAFEQGRQCIEGIVARRAAVPEDVLELLVVGCGPAGLSASLHALHHGLRFLTLEKEPDIGGAVRSYPRKKIVMTGSVKVPGYGRLALGEVRKERLVEIWADVVARTRLRVRTGETVLRIARDDDGFFTVSATSGTFRSARVLLAIGRRGTPRKLGVAGEETGPVVYSLEDPAIYAGDRCVVVGGGDSAVEAALALAEQPGTRVRLSYRGEKLSRVKEANRLRFQDAVARGAVEPLWGSVVSRIEPGRVHLAPGDDAGPAAEVDADQVFVLIGGELPAAFLRECGVELETRFGTP